MRQRTTPEPDSPTPVGPTPWKVVAVRALPQYRLFVRFVDGTEGEVNAGAMILGPKAGVFERLRDQDLRVRITRKWPDGDLEVVCHDNPVAVRMIERKSTGLREAPPIKPPSTSGAENRSAALAALQLPP